MKFKLLVEVNGVTAREMHDVIDSQFVFRRAPERWGFWFDSVSERLEAEKKVTTKFISAKCTNLDDPVEIVTPKKRKAKKTK